MYYISKKLNINFPYNKQREETMASAMRSPPHYDWIQMHTKPLDVEQFENILRLNSLLNSNRSIKIGPNMVPTSILGVDSNGRCLIIPNEGDVYTDEEVARLVYAIELVALCKCRIDLTYSHMALDEAKMKGNIEMVTILTKQIRQERKDIVTMFTHLDKMDVGVQWYIL